MHHNIYAVYHCPYKSFTSIDIAVHTVSLSGN
jgi:hypothetical protein